MTKKYSILISHHQGYPFDIRSDIVELFSYEVKIKLDIQQEFSFQTYRQRIKKIADLEFLNNSFIKLEEVVEDRIQNCLFIIYEFIPFSLEDIHQIKIQSSILEVKLHKLCQFLLQKRILPNYNSNFFGFSSSRDLKYLLLPNFQQISDDIRLKKQFDELSYNISNLVSNLKPKSPISPRQTLQQDKFSQRISERASQRDLSAYNKQFEEKIASIERKLLLSRQSNNEKLSKSQKIKRRKKLSQNFSQENISVSSSSSNSLNRSKPMEQKSYINVNIKPEFERQYSRTQNDKFYKGFQQKSPQNSVHSQQNDNENGQNHAHNSNLTNSLIIEQKNQQMQKLKHHKSSFGDYSNNGNESEKESKLKRRVSFALQKSQYALKVYQKYQSRRSHHQNTQKKT